MSFNNRNNLPNPSAPWGREVEQRIEGAERNISQTSLESSNGLSSVSNTLATLSNTLNALAAQQTRLVEQQTRIAETNIVYPRTSAFTKSGGSATGQAVEFTGTFTKPSWAKFAVVSSITSSVTGSLTPSTGSAEEPEVSNLMFASASPIGDVVDVNSWRVVWYVSPYDVGGAYQNFAVDVSASPVLYVKQIVIYNAIASATASASQAITIQWV